MTTLCQVVNIPDANFKNALLADDDINDNGDNEIQVSEAEAFSGTLNMDDRNIADLTGIESFINLTTLYCRYNQLTSLNLSSNIYLERLSVFSNQLTNLNVSANTALYILSCGENQLTSLDVSSNTSLISLSCLRNQLTTLDVSTNTNLTDLGCSQNQLTSLDISTNTELDGLDCAYNQLTNLDASSNNHLLRIDCSNNQLVSLNTTGIVLLNELNCSNNQLTNLDILPNHYVDDLNCSNNQFTSLDFKTNTLLRRLDCSNNQLTDLTIKKAPTPSFTSLNTTNNPNLTCIVFNDVAWANEHWTFANGSIDSTSSFHESCTIGIEEGANSGFIIYPNPTTSTLTIQNASGLYHLSDITGKTLLSGLASGETNFTIDISALSSGVYFLTLSEGGQQVVRKVVKQ